MADSRDLQAVKLKSVKDEYIRDRSAPDYSLAIRGEVTKAKERERRDYFFSTGLDKWYSSLEDHTFQTEFVDITATEAKVIVEHWASHFKDEPSGDEGTAAQSMIAAYSPELNGLEKRIDDLIEGNPVFKEKGVFVKLSTRSPKDSQVAFTKAKKVFESKVNALADPTPNNKLILLQEILIECLNVKSGAEAIQLLISSNRVGEDLDYGLANNDEVFSKTCKLVIREWIQLPLWAEFRGFVWCGKLTALGQYNHPVVFPVLKAKACNILQDVRAFFELIKSKIPLDRYIVDFGWTPNKVYLVEINPFDGEIVFPASTGLWNWDIDRQQMMNGPLEIRIREKELDENSFKKTTDPQWRTLIFQKH